MSRSLADLAGESAQERLRVNNGRHRELLFAKRPIQRFRTLRGDPTNKNPCDEFDCKRLTRLSRLRTSMWRLFHIIVKAKISTVGLTATGIHGSSKTKLGLSAQCGELRARERKWKGKNLGGDIKSKFRGEAFSITGNPRFMSPREKIRAPFFVQLQANLFISATYRYRG